MMLKADPKYPSRRTYVVKVHGDATRDALRGRLENLVTCQLSDFTSARELLNCSFAMSTRALRGPSENRAVLAATTNCRPNVDPSLTTHAQPSRTLAPVQFPQPRTR